MKKLLAASALLALVGSLCSGVTPASASAASICTATNGDLCTFGNWIVYNNTWGPSPGRYVLHARNQSQWAVVADQNGGGGCGGCAVEVYESAQWNYSNVPYSSIKYLSSTFRETMPTGSLRKNGVDAEAAYDMFLNGSDTDEVMVWVDNQGQTPAGTLYGVANIHGQKFKVYVSAGTKSFLLTKNETHGTVDYYAVLTWLHNHGMLASSDTLSQFNFGWEICDTGGKALTFAVYGLTLHQSF